MTLTRYILVEQKRHPTATGDLSIILNAIQTACKAITATVRRAGLLNIYGAQGSQNVSGDDQKRLDVIANDIFVNSIKHTGLVGAWALLRERLQRPPGPISVLGVAVRPPGESRPTCR
jgi:fructose-1,6-bisphosphatase